MAGDLNSGDSGHRSGPQDIRGPSDDLNTWKQEVSSNFVTVACKPAEDIPFHSVITRRHQAREVNIASVTSTPITYVRSAREIQRDTKEDLQVTLLLEGKLRVCQSGRESIITPGEMVMYEGSSPFKLEFPEAFQTITLRLPCPLLSARLPTINDYSAIGIKTSCGTGSLVKSMMDSIIALDPNDLSVVFASLESPLLDVLAVVLEKEIIGASPGGQGNGKLRNIQNWILQHLDDPGLDASSIASHHCVSMRTLNRLFAMEGITLRSWLIQRRLDASYRLLSERRVDRVTEAALACGFSDLSHFSRVFSKAYGISPKDLIRRHKS